jgi:DNA repair exonuclease SbcCD ATPase subunit
MRYILEVSKKRLEELETQNKVLIEKTNHAIKDFKEDYTKLIDVVKDKENDIKELAKQLTKKDDMIQSLEERLLAIFVYEHKIKTLDSKYKKETSKLVTEYETKLKDLTDLQKNDPNLYREKMMTEERLHNYEKSLTQVEKEKEHFEKKLMKTVKNLNNIVNNKNEIIRKVKDQNLNLKEDLTDKNKSLNYMQKNTEM